MAKYLRQDQIRSGTTIFVVHPKFGGIVEKFVLDMPRVHSVGNDDDGAFSFKHIVKRFTYQRLNHYDINKKTGELLGMQSESAFCKSLGVSTRTHFGYCGDDGIPDSSGKFEYRQQRRAFKTLKQALKYCNDQQTPENKRKWAEENAENSAWDW